MGKKGENKSLFLYTALIFIVALLLIILSFFGDSHMKKASPNLPQRRRRLPAAAD